jgi:hypothetical protein
MAGAFFVEKDSRRERRWFFKNTGLTGDFRRVTKRNYFRQGFETLMQR